MKKIFNLRRVLAIVLSVLIYGCALPVHAVGAGIVEKQFIQSRTGAVKKTYADKLSKKVNVTDFGAVADWNGSTGTNNTTAFINALSRMKAIGGGTLVVPPGDYYFGTYSTSTEIVAINDLSNTLILAYGARFIANTAAESTPFLFVFTNPNNVVMAGARFFDVGFNPASWLTHSRWGMGAVALKATIPSKGFKLVDCAAENLTYLLVADLRAHKRMMKDISVVDCKLKNAYYGVDVLYVGDNLKINNLICEDVRRGFISYGAKNADVDIKLRTSAGFWGSNGFISIASEGNAYDDGHGVIGTDADVNNVRIKLNVSGVEAHSAYVHFYHQQNDSTGSIANVDANVKLNNLSQIGKNTRISATNMFLFDHELPSGTILRATSRTFKKIRLSGGIVGTISGVPVLVSSKNAGNKATLSLSPNLAKLSYRTLSVTCVSKLFPKKASKCAE